jgi:hypothetical protein
LALAVENHSSRAGNFFDAHAIILGQKCVPLTIDQLEKKEPREESSEYKNQDKVKEASSSTKLRGAVLPVDIGEQCHLLLRL